jgi:superoxide dismutase, Fe-Mn family
MIHVQVPLPYKIEDGMGDFLSPAALQVVAVDYQQGLLDRLNEQIKGEPRRAAFLSLVFY